MAFCSNSGFGRLVDTDVIYTGPSITCGGITVNPGDTVREFISVVFLCANDIVVEVEGNSLPTPNGTGNKVAFVGSGTYTQSGGPDIVVPSGNMGVLSWDGSEWSLSQSVEMPMQDLTYYIKKSDFISGNLFNEESLVNLVMNSSMTWINNSPSGLSFYYPIKMGAYFRVERPVALTDRFAVGFTTEEPAPNVDLIDATDSSETFYEGISPVEGYIFIYVSSSVGSDTADFSNISFVKSIDPGEIAMSNDVDRLQSEVDDIKDVLSSGNIFDEDDLLAMALGSSLETFIPSVNGKVWTTQVMQGDIIDAFRDEALTNRFGYGFSLQQPAVGVSIDSDYIQSSMLEYHGIVAPFDGWFFMYLSSSADSEDRDFSNINIEVKSKAKVVDNLDSNLSYASLSANMGRVLKEMIESGGGGGGTSIAHMFGNFNELYRESNAPDMSGTLPDMTTNQLISLIDTAISVDNRGITKEIIGYGADANNDPDTNAPIVEYTFTPTMFNPSWEEPRYLTDPPVILITGGIHGNEKLPPYAIYRFIEMLVSDMSDSIRSIRDNVILKIIPVAVPWSFDNHSRENINGVNINRDFGINNQNPQQETIAIKNWLNTNNTAPVYIDFHNSYYNQSGISYIITDSDRQAHLFSSLTRRLSPIWKAKFLPSENDNFTRGFVQTYVGMGPYQGVAAYYADAYVNIPRSAVLEATKNWAGNLNNWYTEEATEVNIELLVNYVLGTIGSMNK